VRAIRVVVTAAVLVAGLALGLAAPDVSPVDPDRVGGNGRAAR